MAAGQDGGLHAAGRLGGWAAEPLNGWAAARLGGWAWPLSRSDYQFIRLLPLRQATQQTASIAAGLPAGCQLKRLSHTASNDSSGNSHCGWPHNKLLPGLRLNILAQATEPALPSALLKLLLPGLGRHIVCTPGGCIALCQSTNLSPPQVSSQCAKAKS